MKILNQWLQQIKLLIYGSARYRKIWMKLIFWPALIYRFIPQVLYQNNISIKQLYYRIRAEIYYKFAKNMQAALQPQLENMVEQTRKTANINLENLLIHTIKAYREDRNRINMQGNLLIFCENFEKVNQVKLDSDMLQSIITQEADPLKKSKQYISKQMKGEIKNEDF